MRPMDENGMCKRRGKKWTPRHFWFCKGDGDDGSGIKMVEPLSRRLKSGVISARLENIGRSKPFPTNESKNNDSVAEDIIDDVV